MLDPNVLKTLKWNSKNLQVLNTQGVDKLSQSSTGYFSDLGINLPTLTAGFVGVVVGFTWVCNGFSLDLLFLHFLGPCLNMTPIETDLNVAEW